jgi:hypothetical protein
MDGAIKALGIILYSYPSANRDGIETFYKLAVESLSEFPDEILDRLAHPRLGIVTRSTFLPSIAELRKFCNEEIAARHKAAVWDNQEEVRRLHAPPVDPEKEREQRQKILGMFKQLSREIGRPSSAELLTVEEEKAKAARWLEQQAELVKTQPKIQFSDRLRAMMMGEKRDA